MTIKCTDNRLKILSKDLQKFAFGRNGDGNVDLTPGGDYEYWGFRKNRKGSFVLICTDLIHRTLPWWMPIDFFDRRIIQIDETWHKKSWGFIGRDTIYAPKEYFDAMEDIEDGTAVGHKVFEQMKRIK